jgi:hypothetical protein
MTDTEPDVARKFYEMIMTRSGEERFMMGIHSFEAARAIVMASLPPNLPERDLKHRLFERFYGASVDEVLRGAAGSLEHTSEARP